MFPLQLARSSVLVPALATLLSVALLGPACSESSSTASRCDGAACSSNVSRSDASASGTDARPGDGASSMDGGTSSGDGARLASDATIDLAPGRDGSGPDAGTAQGDASSGGTDGSSPVDAGASEGGSADGQAALAAPVFKVGSFRRSAARGRQMVSHGLGVMPAALLVWTAGVPTEGFVSGVRFGMGFAARTSDGFRAGAVSTFHQNDAKPTNNSRRAAAHLVSVVDANETLYLEGDLVAWDATTITLDWTTNRGDATMVHFLAIGGPGVSATVLDWDATQNGRKSVTGLGLRPDTLLHLWAGAALATLGTSAPDGNFGLGVMSSAGQWALDLQSPDGDDENTTMRAQRGDVGVNMQRFDAVRRRARLVSLDADGFTLEQSTSDAAPTRVLTLALSGVAASAGSLAKTKGEDGTVQTTTGVGFRPGALLLAGVQEEAGIAFSSHSYFGLGVTDGKTQLASAFTDFATASPTVPESLDQPDRAFVKLAADGRLPEAEARLSGFSADGFALEWVANDPFATQIFYLAFGQPGR